MLDQQDGEAGLLEVAFRVPVDRQVAIRERERALTDVENAESQPQVDGRQTFEAEPLSPPIRDRRGGPKPPWLWYPLFTVLLIALGAVGYQALLKWAGPTPGEATVASDALALALRVERKDNDLRVSWNRKATAVIQAKEAALAFLAQMQPTNRVGRIQRIDADAVRDGDPAS